MNTDIPDPLMGTQSAAQLAAAARAAEVRDRGEMSQNEFLDWLAASGFLTSPWYRVKLVDIQLSHDRRALLAALTAILRDMGQVSEGSNGDHATRRAYTKFLMLGRVLVRRPLGRVRKGKLNIHDWSTAVRLRFLIEGRFLKELWDDSVALYPLGPQAPQARRPTVANQTEPVPANMQLGAVEEGGDDTILDECIRVSREQPRSQRCNALAEPNSQEGLAIHYLLAQNLIGRAASRLNTEVNGSVDEAGQALLRTLHPPARNLVHRDPAQEQQLPQGAPKLIITAENVIQAAQTAPRGSTGGPDSVVLDFLTRPLLGLDVDVFRQAGLDELTSNPAYAYLGALQTVIQQFADGGVPADLAAPLFSATGFAFAKPEGGIRPVACGVALRRLALRTILRASTDSIHTVLGKEQFGVCYPGGAETCKLGMEAMLINSQQAFLWIDSTNAFNTICRQLIKEAVTLFVPQWLNIFASCYEIKTKFIIRTASNEEANITSEEGVHQGCPLGPALFCLALRLVHLLVRQARGTAIDPAQEGVSAYALEQGTWAKVLHRFNSDGDLQEHIRTLMEQRPEYLRLDHDADTLEGDVQPASLDPQQTLRSYMDDQYAVGLPGSLAFEYALIAVVSKHYAGLEPNVDKVKLKTGMFIPYKYGRVEELRNLFKGAIISTDTPTHERGVKVLGSILRNSHEDYITTRLERMLKKAINTHAIPLLHLHRLQDRYHIMHKSFMHRFTHIFRTLPPCHTQKFAKVLEDTFVRLFDYCTGGHRTKMPTIHTAPGMELAQKAHYYRLFLSYKAGGMGLVDPHMLCHTAYLGCWISLLTHEGGERWRRSFPSLTTMCSDKVLGAETLAAGTVRSEGFGDLVDQLRRCQAYVANPQFRYNLPCPLGQPPVCGKRPQHQRDAEPITAANAQAQPPPRESVQSRLLLAWQSEDTVSFGDLEDTDYPQGTKSGQHELSAHSQRHLSKVLLKSLLDAITHDPGSEPEAVVVPLLRIHASIISGSGPDAAVTFMAIPSDPRSTLSNEEWRINAQLRLAQPLASYHAQPHAPCPHGCRHPQTNAIVNARYGWHLVTNCQRANQGKKAHKDIEFILTHYFNTYTHITAIKAKPFANTNMQADILLSGITTIDNPDVKNLHIDVTSTNPMGASNQDLKNRYRPARQSDPSEHDDRNNTLVSAVWAESKKHAKYDNLCAAAGTTFSPFALETMGAHGASTKTISYLFTKHLRDSGVPGEALKRKLKKDISFALRRGTIAQVTTALDAAQRAAEAE